MFADKRSNCSCRQLSQSQKKTFVFCQLLKSGGIPRPQWFFFEIQGMFKASLLYVGIFSIVIENTLVDTFPGQIL